MTILGRQSRLPIRLMWAPIRPNPNTTTWATPLPLPSQASTTNPQGALRGIQLGFSNSYVYQFNMNVQRDLGLDTVMTVAYVGELGMRCARRRI